MFCVSYYVKLIKLGFPSPCTPKRNSNIRNIVSKYLIYILNLKIDIDGNDVQVELKSEIDPWNTHIKWHRN